MTALLQVNGVSKRFVKPASLTERLGALMGLAPVNQTVRAVTDVSLRVPKGEVLGLAGHLFGRHPAAYALAIRGYAFDEFGEGLSPRASANLDAAVAFMVETMRARSFDQRAGRADPPAPVQQAVLN